MSSENEFEQASRRYVRKYVKRDAELHQYNCTLSVQNIVDLKAMAAADKMAQGTFIDRLIEREVRRRERAMQESKAA